MSKKLHFILLGMMRRSLCGQSWLYLNWLRRFARLGHEIWYVEDDAVWLYDSEQNAVTYDCSYAVRHLASFLELIGLPGQWALRFMGREEVCRGLPSQALNELYCSCDALLNIGRAAGSLRLAPGSAVPRVCRNGASGPWHTLRQLPVSRPLATTSIPATR
jgi:hypothetical protein